MIDDKRFRVLMETWRDWHRAERLVEGYAEESKILASNRSRLFEELCEDVDAWTSEVIESEVNDMAIVDRDVIQHVWLFSAWRGTEPLEGAYRRARERLVSRLESRGVQ